MKNKDLRESIVHHNTKPTTPEPTSRNSNYNDKEIIIDGLEALIEEYNHRGGGLKDNPLADKIVYIDKMIKCFKK